LRIKDTFIGEAVLSENYMEYNLPLPPSLDIKGDISHSIPRWSMVFEWRGKFYDKKKRHRLFEFKEIKL